VYEVPQDVIDSGFVDVLPTDVVCDCCDRRSGPAPLLRVRRGFLAELVDTANAF
jgi:hypothetical protein